MLLDYPFHSFFKFITCQTREKEKYKCIRVNNTAIKNCIIWIKMINRLVINKKPLSLNVMLEKLRTYLRQTPLDKSEKI